MLSSPIPTKHSRVPAAFYEGKAIRVSKEPIKSNSNSWEGFNLLENNDFPVLLSGTEYILLKYWVFGRAVIKVPFVFVTREAWEDDKKRVPILSFSCGKLSKHRSWLSEVMNGKKDDWIGKHTKSDKKTAFLWHTSKVSHPIYKVWFQPCCYFCGKHITRIWT